MSDLEKIHSLVDSDISLYKDEMKALLFDEKKVVKSFVSHILKSQGKQIRPLILFLTARMYGNVTKESYIAAALIEMTHCASLIHDDIIDEAYQRRGISSIYAIWRGKKSVLIGDYIFSKTMRCAVENKLYDILYRMSETFEKMSISEIEQSDASARLDITEEKYYDIIRGKTAMLISNCAYSGASTSGADEEACKKMSDLGELIGMIFQIKDDILDYSQTNILGKLSCNDIKERKITLPLIHALSCCDSSERKRIMKLLRDVSVHHNAVKEIHDFVITSDAMNYCNGIMKDYADRANVILESAPKNEYSEALRVLINYIIERPK